ncbi:BnaA04g15150D [Brassica napus]|uniref:BnaA04g15150D protein n=1 Tax=Brassica napus TaxID=3708 RepID=A0A078HC22_BRANA|nr:BnaA04g15150D [Brassica napus]
MILFVWWDMGRCSGRKLGELGVKLGAGSLHFV